MTDKDKAAREYADKHYACGLTVECSPEAVRKVMSAAFVAGDSHGRQSLARELLEWVGQQYIGVGGVSSFLKALRKKLEGEK